MDSTIPTWLTEDFIKRALENKTPNEVISIDSFDVVYPMAKGDNYICDILRVSVKYHAGDKSLETSLIIKTPKFSGMNNAIQRMGLLKKEVGAYNEFLPKVSKLLRSKQVANIAADCYYSDNEDILVLEDLKAKGYIMADRRRQLDYDHSVVALKALAQFHAASVKIHEEDPVTVEEIATEAFFNDEIKEFNYCFAEANIKLLAKECEKVPEMERYAQQLTGYAENAWGLLVELIKPKKDSFNVLNHGDFWVNNMLFRYENDKPVSVNLMDFQITRYTWPSFDILYFFYTSVREEVRLNHREDLLNEYISELNSKLELFGTTKRLDKSELKTMMDESEFFGMLVSFSFYPIIIGDPKDGVMELGQLDEKKFNDLENNPMGHYYKNKTFLDVTAKRLVEFERNGWF